MLAHLRGTDAQRQGLSGQHRPVLHDPVLDVHEPDGGEREAPVRHQRQLQRKREHMDELARTFSPEPQPS